VPRAFGGAELPVVTVVRVVFILGAADLALAQIPQNDFDFVDTLVQATPETRSFFYGEVLAGARFGNALAEPGRKSRRDLATTIVEVEGGYRL
ncbi:SfnB family sulfur acquisition oxidoreductase, partial [Salmonella enterica]